MQRHIVETADGSHSLFVPALDEHYHSTHGALQESRHVFLEAGLRAMAARKNNIAILEIGLGTGLNALLTALAAAEWQLDIDYCAIEAFPLAAAEIASLNYATLIGGEMAATYWEGIHGAAWERETRVHPQFRLQKRAVTLQDFEMAIDVDLIYFDAFAPEKQPEMWSPEIFARMFAMLRPGGMLVTYCAKGSVRRAMQAAGFAVERIPGPPGKREMLRASKQA